MGDVRTSDLLGPTVGVAIGAGGAWLIDRADAAFGISREYQALYGIGLVLLAFTGAQGLGGDGFLVAFSAGLAVALLNFDLCDCFLDYGETATEMAMPLAFVFFGAVISELTPEVSPLPALLLAAVVILVARPPAIGLVLWRAAVSYAARAFIGWFGPRGVNSLLLALLVFQSGVANAEFLLAVTGVVVTVSVMGHGISATPLSALYGRAASGLFGGAAKQPPRIDPDELAEQLEGSNLPIVLDVRTRSQYERGLTRIPGSIRVAPHAVCGTGRRVGSPNILRGNPTSAPSLPTAPDRRRRPAPGRRGGSMNWASKQRRSEAFSTPGNPPTRPSYDHGRSRSVSGSTPLGAPQKN